MKKPFIDLTIMKQETETSNVGSVPMPKDEVEEDTSTTQLVDTDDDDDDPKLITLKKTTPRKSGETSKSTSKTGGVTWEKRFAQLKTFHGKNGHCKVPKRKGDGNAALAAWVYRQREKLFDAQGGNLSDDQKRRLKNLGLERIPSATKAPKKRKKECNGDDHKKAPPVKKRASNPPPKKRLSLARKISALEEMLSVSEEECDVAVTAVNKTAHTQNTSPSPEVPAALDSTKKAPTIICKEDQLTDYHRHSLQQYRYCQLSDSDRNANNNRKNMKIGHGGMCCVHCADLPSSRKFFFSSAASICSSFSDVPRHVLECSECPREIKATLVQMEKLRKEQRDNLPTGSLKRYYHQLWHRLHGEETTSEDKAAIDSSTPTGKESKLQSSQRTSGHLPHTTSLLARRRMTAVSKKTKNSNKNLQTRKLPTAGADMSSFVSVSAARTRTEEGGNGGAGSISELSNSSTAASAASFSAAGDGFSEGGIGGGNVGSELLLKFLKSQAACLKVPPAKFHQWLLSEDIFSISHLALAFEDVDYHTDLKCNGLVAFMKKRFRKAVKEAAAEVGDSKVLFE